MPPASAHSAARAPQPSAPCRFTPFFGMSGPYTRAKDPFLLWDLGRPSPVRDYARYFYNQTAAYLAQASREEGRGGGGRLLLLPDRPALSPRPCPRINVCHLERRLALLHRAAASIGWTTCTCGHSSPGMCRCAGGSSRAGCCWEDGQLGTPPTDADQLPSSPVHPSPACERRASTPSAPPARVPTETPPSPASSRRTTAASAAPEAAGDGGRSLLCRATPAMPAHRCLLHSAPAPLAAAAVVRVLSRTNTCKRRSGNAGASSGRAGGGSSIHRVKMEGAKGASVCAH